MGSGKAGIILPEVEDFFEEEVGIGLQDGNECTDPITPHVRVLDAINPVEKGMKRAISSGVTCVCIAPGSGNVVGGQMTTIKTYGSKLENAIIFSISKPISTVLREAY